MGLRLCGIIELTKKAELLDLEKRYLMDWHLIEDGTSQNRSKSLTPHFLDQK